MGCERGNVTTISHNTGPDASPRPPLICIELAQSTTTTRTNRLNARDFVFSATTPLLTRKILLSSSRNQEFKTRLFCKLWQEVAIVGFSNDERDRQIERGEKVDWDSWKLSYNPFQNSILRSECTLLSYDIIILRLDCTKYTMEEIQKL